MKAKTILKTLSVRVRDKHAKTLRQMAFEVNQSWNLANEISSEAAWIPMPEVGFVKGYILSVFDIQKLTAGIQQERNWLIGSATVQEVIAEHGKARKQYKTSKLKWRASSGRKRALGWVPFKARAAQLKNGQVKFAGHYFKIWDSYGLSQYQFRAGSFAEDSRGRWYFNISVEAEVLQSTGTKAIGVDLGIKDTATCSDGTKLEARKAYRELEQKLGIAQRAGHKKRVRSIHAKIKNRRNDSNHKFSTALVSRSGAIFVGNVSSRDLVKKKRMAKSILDAGWHQLKTQLEYKAIARSVVFEEINEAFTTQTCSCCGENPSSSPKGRAGLGMREWTCCVCGSTHDRDVNAARNILALGHERLAGGIPVL